MSDWSRYPFFAAGQGVTVPLDKHAGQCGGQLIINNDITLEVCCLSCHEFVDVDDKRLTFILNSTRAQQAARNEAELKQYIAEQTNNGREG